MHFSIWLTVYSHNYQGTKLLSIRQPNYASSHFYFIHLSMLLWTLKYLYLCRSLSLYIYIYIYNFYSPVHLIDQLSFWLRLSNCIALLELPFWLYSDISIVISDSHLTHLHIYLSIYQSLAHVLALPTGRSLVPLGIVSRQVVGRPLWLAVCAVLASPVMTQAFRTS